MKRLPMFSLLLILSLGCNKLQMDIPDTGRKLAINGVITTDDFLNLRITRSSYITDFEGPDQFSVYDLHGVKVRIYQDDNKIDILHHIPNPFTNDSLDNTRNVEMSDWWNVFPKSNYVSNSIKPLPGGKYRVTANFPGLPEASATTVIPEMVKIEKVDSMRITLAPGSYYESNIGLRCKIKLSDPGSHSNFYLFRVYKNTYYEWEINEGTYHQSDDLYFTSDDPVIEEKIYHVNGLIALIFSDKTINGQTYNLDITIKGELIGNPLRPGIYSSSKEYRKVIHFMLYSITGEYFKYLKTLHEYSKNYGNPLAEPVLVNSNVTGGYGMFTGAAVSSDSIVFQY